MTDEPDFNSMTRPTQEAMRTARDRLGSTTLTYRKPYKPDLAEELTRLLNAHCAENVSNTPDFLLANYLMDCLESFDRAINARERWYGRSSLDQPLAETPDFESEIGTEAGPVSAAPFLKETADERPLHEQYADDGMGDIADWPENHNPRAHAEQDMEHGTGQGHQTARTAFHTGEQEPDHGVYPNQPLYLIKPMHQLVAEERERQRMGGFRQQNALRCPICETVQEIKFGDRHLCECGFEFQWPHVQDVVTQETIDNRVAEQTVLPPGKNNRDY